MSRVDDEGFVAVYHRFSGRYDLVKREYFEPLRHALMNNLPFVEAEGLYGAKVVLRVEDIVGLSDDDPESYKEFRADSDEDKRRKEWS